MSNVVWCEVEGLSAPGLAAWARQNRVRLAGTLAARRINCAGCFDLSRNVFQEPGTPPLRCPGCPVTRARRQRELVERIAER